MIPEQLKQADLPHCMVYLWSCFGEMSAGRQYNEFGPMPLQYSEIWAWIRLTKIELDNWELSVIKRIDSLFLSEAMKK
jgi:hypothetical protein